MKTILLFTSFFILSSCKSISDKEFEIENGNLKAEFSTESEKYVKENASKLSDEKMLNSLDSIVEEYFINRNKKLAIKYIKTKSGVKRLNFLKPNFTKEELKNLLKQVPESIKKDTNYIALQKYIN
ncbi:hypothetical protein [Flavobacterium sp. GT3R68]|uniref:hypothetical protein n=1 Tax=Flavobacterium sp. GT3R68 TaxID=2594437 RepID=UPI000F873A77|nr:hypothetical protein [Flavobacterium sp. GT3R68]RTY85833.1 hypothetical protein EKL32_28295 [Flavobacterium sp. GSN2]TRW89361.1 hypothetical protein FNW07_13390 [Flavobacterium sp. GT3R68]